MYLVPNQSVNHWNPQLPCSNLALWALNVIIFDCVDFYWNGLSFLDSVSSSFLWSQTSQSRRCYHSTETKWNYKFGWRLLTETRSRLVLASICRLSAAIKGSAPLALSNPGPFLVRLFQEQNIFGARSRNLRFFFSTKMYTLNSQTSASTCICAHMNTDCL